MASEAALWAAVRALEEKAALQRRVVEGIGFDPRMSSRLREEENRLEYFSECFQLSSQPLQSVCDGSPVLGLQLYFIDQPHYGVISSASRHAVALFPDLVTRLAGDSDEGQRRLQIEFEKLRAGSIHPFARSQQLIHRRFGCGMSTHSLFP